MARRVERNMDFRKDNVHIWTISPVVNGTDDQSESKQDSGASSS